jgi:catechol 2,3-dioxygenase-like lactoylglutathione lyase family enzyme
MAQAFIEHVNVTVSDIDRTAQMLIDLFGWRIRWRGESALGGHTIHVGTDKSYVAVYMPKDTDGKPRGFSKSAPLNHIGVEVDDLDAIENKVKALGLKPFGHGDYEPGRRFYFFDRDGIEFEVVSYA